MGPEDIEKIFQYVMKKFPEVTKEDIEQKIAEKKEKIGAGYLTDEGAAILVGSDYDSSIPFQFLFTFGIDGIHKVTGTEYNERGFNVDGIHKVTGTQYNAGFDKDGFGRDGFDDLGFGRDGFDENGWNRDGFARGGIHKVTNTLFDPDGFNKGGFGIDGIHKVTNTLFDPDGFNKDGFDDFGFDKDGNNPELFPLPEQPEPEQPEPEPEEPDEDDPDVQLERQLELERAGNCVQDTFEEESEQ